MKLAIKIVAIVVVLAIQVVGAWYLMNYLYPADSANSQSTESSDKNEDKSEEEANPETERAYEFGALHHLPDVIVNPKYAKGRRLFKISMILEYDPENTELATELGVRAPFMVDHALNYLSTMPEDTLGDIRNREWLRDSLRVRLDEFLSTGTIDRILFQDFIRQ
jgi:flagellar basal body-associated protein FliL